MIINLGLVIGFHQISNNRTSNYLILRHFEHCVVWVLKSFFAMTPCFAIYIDLMHRRRVQIRVPYIVGAFAHFLGRRELFIVFTLHPKVDVFFAKLFFQELLCKKKRLNLFSCFKPVITSKITVNICSPKGSSSSFSKPVAHFVTLPISLFFSLMRSSLTSVKLFVRLTLV